MRTQSKRLVGSLCVTLPLAWFATGCGDSSKIELQPAPAPAAEVTQHVKIEDMPKEKRPRVGGSGGMNYDPSGVTPKQ